METTEGIEPVLPQIVVLLKEILVQLQALVQAKAQAKAQAQAQASEETPKDGPKDAQEEEFHPADVARWKSGPQGGARSSTDDATRKRWEAQQAEAAPARRKRPAAKRARAAPAKKAKAVKKVTREYETEKEAKETRLACEESGLYDALNQRWGDREFHARVAAVRACGGRGQFHLLVDALQVELRNKMQTARFMAVVESFVKEKEHRRIAESDAEVDRWVGPREGSDTEVDSDSPYL
jgi:hypothetical protein